jgi:hypothetical protein
MKRAAVFVVLAAAACSSPPTGPQPNVNFEMKVTVPAGGEIHDCKFVTMPAGESYITAAQHMYTKGSHHLLLFRTDLASIPAGQEGIQDCYEGGSGTIMSHVRGVVYGSQVPTAQFALPTGVAMKMKSQEVLLFQVHYLNASPQPLDATVDVGLFTTTDVTRAQTLAGVLFYYDPFIDVPPASKSSAGARCTLPQDITLLSVFPHYHARGYGYQAWLDLPSQPAATTPFYTSTDWEHPAAWTGGPMALPTGTTVRWNCDYDNTGGSAEYFQGQSAANNEMCMFTGMYYPAMDQTAEFCLNNMTGFGTGAATCATTSSCVQACPASEAPDQMGNVGPCWQKCMVSSCASASTPLLEQLRCVYTQCNVECTTGGDCVGCALQKCQNEVYACQSHTCP